MGAEEVEGKNKHCHVNIDMKTKVVQYVPRILTTLNLAAGGGKAENLVLLLLTDVLAVCST